MDKADISCDCSEYNMNNNQDSVPFTLPGSPTNVTLISFQANSVSVADGYATEVHWEIGESFNTSGFDLYRGTSMDPAAAVKLTPHMISVDSAGGVYSFIDETAQPDVAYIYWLFESEYNGSSQNIYGPLKKSMTPANDNHAIYLPFVMKAEDRG